MAHLHSIYDCDTHFVIDLKTREIKNDIGKTVIVQNDHNSERFSFELPKEIEGHDMSRCNVVQVHYVNIDSKTKEQHEGLYEVDDLQISPDSDDVVILSWLLSQNATRAIGSLCFGIVFKCIEEDGTLTYSWHTTVNKDFKVVESLDYSNVILEEYPDILAQFEARLAEVEQNGGSVDLSSYVTKSEMPEIDIDEVVSKVAGSVNIYPAFSADKWTDNSIFDGFITTDENYCYSEAITVKPNTQYSITHEVYRIRTADGVPLGVDMVFGDVTSYEFYTPNNSSQIVITIDKRQFGGTTDINTAVDNFNSVFMLVEGGTLPTEFVPYVKGGYKLNDNVELPDIEITEVPTKVSELENDSGFLAGDENEFVKYISDVTFKAEEVAITENNVTLGTGWSGNNTDGYTHASGNTEPLSFAINAMDGEKYIIEYDCSASGDAILLKLGSAENLENVYPTSPYNGNASNQWGLVCAGNNGILQVIPISTYTGFIKNLKCYKITEDGTNEISVALDNVGIGNLPKHIAGFYNFYLSPTSMQKSVNGTRNVAIGYASLRDIISGGRNIGLGTFSLSSLIYGENNIGIGADAMIYPTLAENIIAIGKGAMGNGKQRTDDIAIGRYALAGNPDVETVTSKNVAIGVEAGRDCESSGNVFIGSAAGAKMTASSNNVVIGNSAGANTTTGWGNTFIGANAKSNGNYSQVTVIGQGAQATKHKQAVFGPDSTVETILKGNVLVRGVDGVFREIAYRENILLDKIESENTTETILPNKYYSFGEVAELTIEFAEGVAEKVNEYMFGFVSGETATVLTLPSSVQWVNELTVEANKQYEISIVDNIGLWVAVDLAVSE